jgi:hypothetical protein
MWQPCPKEKFRQAVHDLWLQTNFGHVDLVKSNVFIILQYYCCSSEITIYKVQKINWLLASMWPCLEHFRTATPRPVTSENTWTFLRAVTCDVQIDQVGTVLWLKRYKEQLLWFCWSCTLSHDLNMWIGRPHFPVSSYTHRCIKTNIHSGIVTRNLYLATVMLTTKVPTKTFITVLKKYI